MKKKYQFEKMSPEQRKECGKKGGIASGEAKRRKKAMRERLEILFDMPTGKGKAVDIESIKNFEEVETKNLSVYDAMMVAVVQRALCGDIPAMTFIRDLTGQKPRQDEWDGFSENDI